MIINKASSQNTVLKQSQAGKKEGFQEPKEEVLLGSTRETPDFLKKPEVSDKPNKYLAAASVGAIGGGLNGVVHGAWTAVLGRVSSLAFGPIGGGVATVMVGVMIGSMSTGVHKTSGREDSLVKGLVAGTTCAASTFLGATGNIGAGILLNTASSAAYGAINCAVNVDYILKED